MKKWLKYMLALTAVAAALTGCGGGGSPGGSEDPKKDDTVINTPPKAIDQNVTTLEDTAKSVTLIGRDDDSGDTLSYTITAQPTHGKLRGKAPEVTYTPEANYHGADSFTFKVNDGSDDSNEATVRITITSVNDAPIATADTATVDEDAPTTSIDVLANDTDVDNNTLSIKPNSVTAPNHGGSAVINGNKIDYTPAANFNGTETFGYTVSDGTLDGNTVEVTVTVRSINDAPIATADTATVDEDAPTTSIDVLANDSDADNDTLSIKAGSITAPNQGGTAVINGNKIDYTPAANFNGTETFSYTVSDGTVDGNTVSVTVTVKSVNDAPTAQATVSPSSAPKGSEITFDASGSTDSDGSITGYEWKEGSTVLSTAVSFTKSDLSIGEHTIVLTVTDNEGATDSKSVTVKILTTLKKTGQTKSYDADGNEIDSSLARDDGHYQTGVDFNYTRDDTKEIVTDLVTGLQ